MVCSSLFLARLTEISMLQSMSDIRWKTLSIVQYAAARINAFCLMTIGNENMAGAQFSKGKSN